MTFKEMIYELWIRTHKETIERWTGKVRHTPEQLAKIEKCRRQKKKLTF